MDEKEKLKELIDNSKKPTVSEWVYEVEAFLEEINEPNTEAWTLIDGIKRQGDNFNRCENLTALLRQLYKRKYEKVAAKLPKKTNQIFVAMMFSDEMSDFYDQAYKPISEDLGYTAMRIDRKDYTGLIIEEIEADIKDLDNIEVIKSKFNKRDLDAMSGADVSEKEKKEKSISGKSSGNKVSKVIGSSFGNLFGSEDVDF